MMLYSRRLHAGRADRARRHRRRRRHLAVPQLAAASAHARWASTRGGAPAAACVVFLFVRAFFITAFAAALGGLFLAAQVQVGDPNGGFSFTLTSIAAAVLGGASLLGGRGSFIGAVIGALFLNVIINILPYLGWSAYGRIAVGLLTLVALSFYQAPQILGRLRTARSDHTAAPPRAEAPTAQAPVA